MFNLGTMMEAGRGGEPSETDASVMFDSARKLGVTERVEVPANGVMPEITSYEISHSEDVPATGVGGGTDTSEMAYKRT